MSVRFQMGPRKWVWDVRPFCECPYRTQQERIYSVRRILRDHRRHGICYECGATECHYRDLWDVAERMEAA